MSLASRIRLADDDVPTMMVCGGGAVFGSGARRERGRPSSPMSRLVVGRAGGRRHVTVRPSAASVTSREHTVMRPRTRTHTLMRRRRPTHITEFPPPATDTAVWWSGQRRGTEKKRTRRAHSAPHILQFAFCPFAGHKCQLSYR